MKILYIVDGRSPTALSWISYFIQAGHDVHVVSTFPCAAVAGARTQYVVPVAMSNLYAPMTGAAKDGLGWFRKALPVRVRTAIRRMAVPLTFSQAITRLQGIIERVQPELVHAMRIPYEGILTAEALRRASTGNPEGRKYPLLISVWGNDFTLHAQSSKALAAQTRQTLQRCDALHTDCRRDQRLASEWGFGENKPKIELPGGGGIQLDIFYPPEGDTLEVNPPKVINPRGVRAYVCNDTFFQSIPLVIDKHPQTIFTCPGMQGEGQVHGWVAELGIEDRVELLPTQTRVQMAELFRQAKIMLSITTHDGTPNSLLEAMACGCYPIAGDIESIREWIIPGENGQLVNPWDPKALASAINQAIDQPEMLARAKEMNVRLVQQRGEYWKCMQAAEEFYKQLIVPTGKPQQEN